MAYGHFVLPPFLCPIHAHTIGHLRDVLSNDAPPSPSSLSARSITFINSSPSVWHLSLCFSPFQRRKTLSASSPYPTCITKCFPLLLAFFGDVEAAIAITWLTRDKRQSCNASVAIAYKKNYYGAVLVRPQEQESMHFLRSPTGLHRSREYQPNLHTRQSLAIMVHCKVKEHNIMSTHTYIYTVHTYTEHTNWYNTYTPHTVTHTWTHVHVHTKQVCHSYTHTYMYTYQSPPHLHTHAHMYYPLPSNREYGLSACQQGCWSALRHHSANWAQQNV